MTRLITPTHDSRLAQLAKAHIDQLLRQGVTGNQLTNAWQALRDTVRECGK